MNEIDKWETQFRKGMMEVLVLQAVKGGKEAYGYNLLLHLEGQGMEITEGTLYPLLNRLQKNGWLVSNWDVPKASGHPKRVYKLSKAGEKLLPEMQARVEYYFQLFTKMRKK